MNARAPSALGSFVLRQAFSLAFAAGLFVSSPAGLADAAASVGICGDATGDGEIEASDALFTLHVAVGTQVGSLLRCDCNESGTVTASDAMVILKAAVGIDVTLRCPLPEMTASTTTSTTSTTTTSLPEFCGNESIDPGEDCEPPESFCRGGCNLFTGICVDFMCGSDCSCPQPLCGDWLIDPNEDCDPPDSPCGSGTCNASCQCGS